MSPKRMLECSFLIPIRRDKELSDGELHAFDAWEWLTRQLYDRFDGWTWSPGLYQGCWKSTKTGQPVPDQSRKYAIALAEENIDFLRRFLAEACQVFQQQCIYLSVAGQVEFIEVLGDGPAE